MPASAFAEVYPAFAHLVDLPLQQLWMSTDLASELRPGHHRAAAWRFGGGCPGTAGPRPQGPRPQRRFPLPRCCCIREGLQAEPSAPGSAGRSGLRPAGILPRARSPAPGWSPIPAVTRPVRCLALKPLLQAGVIRTDGIIIDAVSGVSGAGRKADLAYSFCETDASFKAYSVVGHRHTSEIEQEAGFLAGCRRTAGPDLHAASGADEARHAGDRLRRPAAWRRSGRPAGDCSRRPTPTSISSA